MANWDPQQDVAALASQVEALKAQIQALQRPTGAGATVADFADEGDVDMLDLEEEAQALSWEDVLEATEATATTTEGQKLCQLLHSPPPLSMVSGQEKPVRFSGLPKTVPPRKNMIDRQLWSAQWKLERVMQEMFQALEEDDKSKMLKAGAFARSAWEDLHQQRRRLMVGRQAGALDGRPDEDKPRLLSKEEEQKLRKPRQGKGQEGKGFVNGFGQGSWSTTRQGGKGQRWGPRRSSSRGPKDKKWQK